MQNFCLGCLNSVWLDTVSWHHSGMKASAMGQFPGIVMGRSVWFTRTSWTLHRVHPLLEVMKGVMLRPSVVMVICCELFSSCDCSTFQQSIASSGWFMAGIQHGGKISVAHCLDSRCPGLRSSWISCKTHSLLVNEGRSKGTQFLNCVHFCQ